MSSWQNAAACADADPRWFDDDSTHAAQAITICHGCPAKAECLADAIAQRDHGVIRGGLTTQQRWDLRRRSAPPLCQVCGLRRVRAGRATCQALACNPSTRSRKERKQQIEPDVRKEHCRPRIKACTLCRQEWPLRAFRRNGYSQSVWPWCDRCRHAAARLHEYGLDSGALWESLAS